MEVKSHKGRLSVHHFLGSTIKMKNIVLSLAVVFSLAGSLFAEGNNGPDFSAATTALTDVASSLSSWVTGAMPILVSIAGAFLVFWLGRKVFRIIKTWAGSSS